MCCQCCCRYDIAASSCHCHCDAVSPPATAKATPIASAFKKKHVHLRYWCLASASVDHAATLQAPSTNTVGSPMADAPCNTWRCWMHASTATEINSQFRACATLHANLLSAACARCRARKGRGVQPQPLFVAAGLMLVAARVPPRRACCTTAGSEGLGCTTPAPPTPAPPVCRIEVGLGTGELAKLSADKACVVIGVLGG